MENPGYFYVKMLGPKELLVDGQYARVCLDLEQNCPVFIINSMMKKAMQLKNSLLKEVCMWPANTLTKELERLNGAEAL